MKKPVAEMTGSEYLAYMLETKRASRAIDEQACPNCYRPAPKKCKRCGWKIVVAPPVRVNPRVTFNRRYVKKAKGNHA